MGVVAKIPTPQLGLWGCLLFWFGLFVRCCLSVGRGIAPQAIHGFYVGGVGVVVGVQYFDVLTGAGVGIEP